MAQSKSGILQDQTSNFAFLMTDVSRQHVWETAISLLAVVQTLAL